MSKLLARLGRRPNSGAEVVPRPEGAVGALPSAQAHHDARLAILLEVAERLTRSFDRADVLKTIALEVNAALGADATTIRVLENDQLVVAASAGLTDDEAAALPIFGRDDGWFGAVFQSGRPAVHEDMLENPEYGPMLVRYSPRQAFRSDLVAPLIHEPSIQRAMTDDITRQITTRLNVKGLTEQAAGALTQRGLTRVGALLNNFSGQLASAVYGFIHKIGRASCRERV